MKTKNHYDAKKRIFEIIQIGHRTDFASLAFDIGIVLVIVLNIAVTFAMTFETMAKFGDIFNVIEFVTLLIFLVEYVLRVWTAEYLYPGKKRLKAAVMFICSFYGIVDLLTILPYFLPFFLPSGAVAFRMLRVVRILHLFRINSNYDAFNVITKVLKEKKNQLVSSCFLVLILMMGSSLCMYSLEHEAQPENFANAFSGIWWSVSTLLTVGYGDIYPVTAGGRLMAIVIAFLGVGMVAIPTGIISAGFVEYYTQIKAGTFSLRDASFVTVTIGKGNAYAKKELRTMDLTLPDGLYPVAVIRNEECLMANPGMELMEADQVLLGAAGIAATDFKMEELPLEHGHPWIGERIKDLDISRKCYVLMVVRQGKNMRPAEDMILRKDDVLLLLEKRKWRKKV